MSGDVHSRPRAIDVYLVVENGEPSSFNWGPDAVTDFTCEIIEADDQ
jgi:hypothetical protein